MINFLHTNKTVLWTSFFVLSLTFMLLVTFLLWLAPNDGKPGSVLLFQIYLAAGVAMPAFMLSVGIFKYFLDERMRIRFFNAPPFSLLLEEGFLMHELYKNSRWRFNESVLFGTLGEHSFVIWFNTDVRPVQVMISAYKGSEADDQEITIKEIMSGQKQDSRSISFPLKSNPFKELSELKSAMAELSQKLNVKI